MSADEITAAYGDAKARLMEEASVLADEGAERYALASHAPACAVLLVMDALWQKPQLARPIADYFDALFAARSVAAAPPSGERGEEG